MNKTERLSAVLDLLSESGRIDIDDLVVQLNVSPATARRDLDTLAQQQLLTRTRGGAVAHSVAYDLPLRYKNQHQPEHKRAIARAAMALVPRGAVIGLCGGTTTTAIADALITRADIMEPAPEPGVTVVTNAVNIAMLLAPRAPIKTVMTGGILHDRSYELVGHLAEPAIAALSLDLAFIGANGFVPEHGPACHDEQEAAVSASLAGRARRAVVVADSTKLDKPAFARIGGPGLFTTVVTDAEATSAQTRRLEEAGYEVIVAA